MSEIQPGPVEKYNEGIKQKFPVGKYVLRIYKPNEEKPALRGIRVGRVSDYYYGNPKNDEHDGGSFLNNGGKIISVTVTNVNLFRKFRINKLTGTEDWNIESIRRI